MTTPVAKPAPHDLVRVAEIVEARGRAAERWPANMKPETVAEIAAACRRAGKVLRYVAEHDAGLRTLCQFLDGPLAARRKAGAPFTVEPDEVAALLTHPTVAAVLDTFPEAGFGGARPLARINHEGPAPIDHDREDARVRSSGQSGDDHG